LELFYKNDLPKGCVYEDIDAEMKKFVEELDISFDGKKFPTLNLFSNQRLSEYTQTWRETDAEGGLLLNFKSLTRELNVSKGTIYGDNMGNIPGDDRYYTVGYKPVVENGIETMDKISMKQPL
jgi:hypothetical protein